MRCVTHLAAVAMAIGLLGCTRDDHQPNALNVHETPTSVRVLYFTGHSSYDVDVGIGETMPIVRAHRVLGNKLEGVDFYKDKPMRVHFTTLSEANNGESFSFDLYIENGKLVAEPVKP
jgi:hypothetical protein